MTANGVILLDIHERDSEAFERTFLERCEDHPVVVCHGPGTGLCPLLAGKGCGLFGHAHGIVYELDLDDAQHRRILKAYRRLAQSGMPIRAVASPEQVQEHPALFDGIEIWPNQPSPSQLDGFAAEVESFDRFERIDD